MRVSSGAIAATTLTLLLAGTAPARALGPTTELASGGLVFAGLDRVRVTREDLIIGLDRIELSYVLSAADRDRVSLAIAFPLPVIDTAQLQTAELAVPAYDPSNPTNFVGFWTLVDGVPVEPEVDVRALAVGHIDVTRRLLELGVPLYPFAADIAERLAMLPAEARTDLEDGSIIGEVEMVTKPQWALHTVFHWRTVVTDTAPVTIQHRYKPVAGSAPWSPEIAETAKQKYCLSEMDAAALDRRATSGAPPTVYWVHYHPPANAWIKGSSETFRLTIDKGRAGSIAATCTPGLRSVSETMLEVIAADRTDDSEIDVLFVE